MITTLNRKLLEKQRVQNRFASYEVHIGHFFYNINAAVSFGNRLTLSIFRFLNFSPDGRTDRQTDRQTEKTDCLTPSRMRAQGNQWTASFKNYWEKCNIVNQDIRFACKILKRGIMQCMMESLFGWHKYTISVVHEVWMKNRLSKKVKSTFPKA